MARFGVPKVSSFTESDLITRKSDLKFQFQNQKSGDFIVMSKQPTYVSCWTEWGKLRHVIVGTATNACIPPPEPGYSCRVVGKDLEGTWGPRSQDSIAKANVQLDAFADLLEKRGIRVDRPKPLDFQKTISTLNFEHPGMNNCMSPRDTIITVGKEILEAAMSFRSRWFEYLCYRPLINSYFADDPGMRHEAAPKPSLTNDSFRVGYLDPKIDMEQRMRWVSDKYFVTTENEPLFDAADIVRCGRDLFVQHGFTTNLKGIDWLRRHFFDLRVHAMNFPGDPYPCHIDATFLPLRPGMALSNPVRPLIPEQRRIFDLNDWQIVQAARPAHKHPPPLCYSSIWLSMNVLSLDEKTICVEASETGQMEQLYKLGFEVIPVPFRDAYPFGGGLHCATTDIWRDGDMEDYFPVQEKN
jgi:glycine amidinotransferase